MVSIIYDVNYRFYSTYVIDVFPLRKIEIGTFSSFNSPILQSAVMSLGTLEKGREGALDVGKSIAQRTVRLAVLSTPFSHG